ncbi:nicotinate phosphoribosyltransferase [Natranaerofaba carboxydovora]|uniref:nicotinate phosphoribosyltransferase n=1 Tax=Natranaerofaba carboxydovora TaxID=2742683 RepID=UPI001F137B54|nr:nicotinate phosphoribosyltransferase [Natranaerofaba carboxydovora]UMZ75143.1 Nicotinate phosphoribosyltransferase pncB2 [Natranaerofaba carboxydovora]
METKEGAALHTDLYQLNMMQTYVKKGLQDKNVVFDMFFRRLPFGNGYAIYAGLEHIISYLTNLEFKEEDIEYLRFLGFDEGFLQVLKSLRFTGDVYSMKEGEVIFPNEPILTVEARIIEALLVETALLNIFNHETLIATKASRVKHTAGDKQVVEFGARRAHGLGASLYGTRAAYIAGFEGTSLVEAGKRFDIPVVGTMSHAFVQSFEDEKEAFRAYGEENKDNVILLVDTYNTLKTGVPNAIKVAKELNEKGIKVKAIRLDSGDLAYLSKEARRMLDENGFSDIQIVASSDLDEYVISDLKLQGADLDMYAVGTRVITAYDQPALGGVYKLVEVIEGKERIPKIKVSDNIEKIVFPGRKRPYRIINRNTGKSEGDYITRFEERLPQIGNNLLLFDPFSPWKQKIVEDYQAIELQEKVINNGERCTTPPSLEEIRNNREASLEQLWEEHKRKKNPQKYYVDLSEDLWNLKRTMIEEKRKEYNES